MKRPSGRKRVRVQDEVLSRPYLLGGGLLLILCLIPWLDHRVSVPPELSASILQSDPRLYAVSSETLPLELESSTLSILGEANARQLPLPGGAGVHVEIENNGSEDWEIQWIPCTFDVPERTRLVLSFEARALVPRSMRLELSQNHEPWKPLGYSETAQLTEEWQEFQRTFVTPELPDQGRICFHLGGGASTEIRNLRLESLAPPTKKEPAKSLAPQ